MKNKTKRNQVKLRSKLARNELATLFSNHSNLVAKRKQMMSGSV